MYTSLVLFALVGASIPTPAGSRAPEWLNDYGAACRKGRTEKKPLAIVFGKGEAGWEQLGSGGSLGTRARRLLESSYVPVYFDLETDHGRSMAPAFGLKGGPALVISDHRCEKIALRYTGTLEPADLHRCLIRYADPDRAVQTTDTDPVAEEAPGSYGAALEVARREHRPLLLVFHGEHCIWCKRMERDTFADGSVKTALRRYVVYFVDTEREPGVSQKFLPPSSPIPAYCVVNPGDETVRKDGTAYKAPSEFLSWLE
jgi:thioredoxin-related protein